MKKLIYILLASFSLSACTQKTPDLRQKLEELTKDFPGVVGVAFINDRDTVCINSEVHFPMFSVVKFHQALAVCEKMRSSHCFVPYEIEVKSEDLKPDTWSPMREKFPEGGCFPITELLRWALVESDNNASDILFERVANAKEVNDYIQSIGIEDCSIAWSESEQHADIRRCDENWTTPLAAARLMGEFYAQKDRDEYSRMLWKTMSGCQTGANRIPKYISDSTASIVHKTGTGGPLPDGGVMGINDVACIVLPDGRHIELAVFVKDASCDPASCEELIAEIAKICI